MGTGLTDGVDGEAARPRGTNVHESLTLSIVDCRSISVARGGADTVPANFICAIAPEWYSQFCALQYEVPSVQGLTRFQTEPTHKD